ncbi:MAG: hypothetical protein ACREMY_31670 [bacterium]
MTITIEVLRDEVVTARLASMSQAIRQRLRTVIGKETTGLRDGVKDAISSIFRSRGPLYQSIGAEMEESTTAIGGRVFSEGVPYARIQEYGGTTRPHTIVPKNAKALVFMKSGSLIFARKVNHPGSRIPERSYMRSTLHQMRPEIVEAISDAVGEEVTKE